uniref:Uncharacterized protein n=1 Tax=Oryza nivara TaxID=4536 RepID=A0A0E0J7L3_ORYNI
MALASLIWKDGKLGVEVRHSIGGGGEGFVLLTSPSSRPPASRPSFHVLAALVLAEDGSEERTEETSELSQPNWWASGGFPIIGLRLLLRSPPQSSLCYCCFTAAASSCPPTPQRWSRKREGHVRSSSLATHCWSPRFRLPIDELASSTLPASTANVCAHRKRREEVGKEDDDSKMRDMN